MPPHSGIMHLIDQSLSSRSTASPQFGAPCSTGHLSLGLLGLGRLLYSPSSLYVLPLRSRGMRHPSPYASVECVPRSAVFGCVLQKCACSTLSGCTGFGNLCLLPILTLMVSVLLVRFVLCGSFLSILSGSLWPSFGCMERALQPLLSDIEPGRAPISIYKRQWDLVTFRLQPFLR